MSENKCPTREVNIELKEEEEEDAFQCDLCETWFHSKCEKVIKKDVKAQKSGKRLRIHCNKCEECNEKVFMSKMHDMLQIVSKIDMEIQQRKLTEQKNEASLAFIVGKLSSLEDKFNTEISKPVSFDSNGSTQKPSYSNVTQTGAVKTAVVIKPKKKQHSKTTMEQIAKTVDKSQLKVCGTHNIRDGGVVLCCNNRNETMKVKELVREKLGDDYEVVSPAIRKPRIRITNIDPNIPDKDIINELKLNNKQIENVEMNLITVIPKRNRGTASNDIVVEINAESYKNLLEIGVLELPWRECRVLEHIHLKRCFKCCGFSHTSIECHREQTCSNCAGQHKHAVCRNKKNCCINCKMANERLNINLDTNHHAWSRNCDVLQRRINKIRNQIDFNFEE